MGSFAREDRLLGRLEARVTELARAVRLLGAVTPTNAVEERARLVRAVAAGHKALPRWRYPAREHGGQDAALLAAGREARSAGGSPSADLLRERLEELTREAAIVRAVGHPSLAAAARERFGPDPAYSPRADALGEAYLATPLAASVPSAGEPSDGPGPTSLLARMGGEVGRQRLSFRVVVAKDLLPLAATGEHTIYVAAAREVDDETSARTVLHEVLGHASPRHQARLRGLALLSLGTARGTDDQEGRALLLEERHGFATPRRLRELGARHEACRWMAEGATFADVAHRLHHDHGFDPSSAVRLAERTFRGGDGVAPGLGRERVYLEAYVRVREHLTDHPEDEAVLACGQVGIHAVATVRELLGGAP